MNEKTNDYNSSNLTFEKVWQMFQETDRKFQETDKKFQETDKKIDKLLQSSSRFGNFINNIADTVEYFFQDAFSDMLEKDKRIKINGYVFEDMLKNYEIGQKRKKKEVDIILVDDVKRVIAIVEIKTKLHQNNFEDLNNIDDYLQRDRIFSKYKYILGFASFNIPRECEEVAQKKGFFLVKPNIKRTAIQKDYLNKFKPKLH